MTTAEMKGHKVTKRIKESKTTKTIEITELPEHPTTNDRTLSDAKQQLKKSQGVVIDGKTYTCATCKTGHRVGICKHASDRPMKPTHPPGRPPAGAPKKVVCDCPRTCSCTKKDCKCARKCNCTQYMYMLVYIPAPEEEDDANKEKGQWKLGEQVTTDLKGNILTPEQVRERRRKKEATNPPPVTDISSHQTPLNLDQAKPIIDKSETEANEPVKSCCKHKETVANQKTAIQSSLVPDNVSKASTKGCNCGHTCNCAFCPEHPNNSISQNRAVQGATYFINHESMNHESMNSESIIPFHTTQLEEEEDSCMGGAPQYAVSKNYTVPSIHDIHKTFPNPGYIIAYPIRSTRTGNFSAAPFPVVTNQPFDKHLNLSNMGNGMIDGVPMQFQTPGISPFGNVHEMEYLDNGFSIGNAFVASAGVGEWQPGNMSPGFWPMDFMPAANSSLVDFPGANPTMSTDIGMQSLHVQATQMMPHTSGNNHSNNRISVSHPPELVGHHNILPVQDSGSDLSESLSSRSFRQPSLMATSPFNGHEVSTSYFSPTLDPSTLMDNQLYLNEMVPRFHDIV